MKLRLILLVLSLLAFLSATIGGYFYYTSLKKAVLVEAESGSAARLDSISRNISSLLTENVKPARLLAGSKELARLLAEGGRENQKEVDRVLDHFKESLEADVCYLMDARGLTVASSNRQAADSFVGKDFSFRPYFKEAVIGQPASYLALGVTSGKRGGYYSYPVFAPGVVNPMGVAVVKASIEQVEKELALVPGEKLLVIDPDGIVFITNHRPWLYRSFHALDKEHVEYLRSSRQFGSGPWPRIDLRRTAHNQAIDQEKINYVMYSSSLKNYSGWQVIYLRELNRIYRSVSAPFVKIAGSLVFSLCLLVGLAVFFLYRQATAELLKRHKAEDDLRQSELRYRSLYHDTPAMLHSIDPQGRLLSVSDYWLDVMGYDRKDVIGCKIVDYYTAQSKKIAEEEVIPRFFREGFCRDISHRLVKKDGSEIDVLLSATGVRDDDGRIVRSLAVSVDVTERRRAEQMLHRTKEALASYSRDLEQQVHARTLEIEKARDQLRRLSARMMTSQEQERAALARELHDELGQVLTALRIDGVWLHHRLSDQDYEAAERARTMTMMVDDTIDEVRSLAFRLRPGVLDDLGLKEALELYTADWERRVDIVADFQCECRVVVSGGIATAAYRIAQEALTNVARHAGASHVEIKLKADEDKLVLSIIDDGCGFVVGDIVDVSGLGLTGMKERASLVNGQIEVISEPDKGTTIKFMVDSPEGGVGD